MDLEIVVTDLKDKIPCLRHILRPEYTPYLTTTATILIGWLFVSCIFHLIWMLLAPLTISVIAIAVMCPITSKWCFQQIGTNLEGIANDFVHKVQDQFFNMNLSMKAI